MKKRKIEILAPAGSYDSLKAAVCAGADAVYMGGTRFGARAFAPNFTEAEMLSAIDYAHIHGRQVYMTVNTLLKDQEINALPEYLLPYYRQGLDGVIVQDLGAAEVIKKIFPKMELHASTQMTIANAEGAEFLKRHGFVRVVPARELSLSEIRMMKQQTGMEIECFVHGALCYCYSGQCLLSSMIGGRSGNRGQCAQPCRLPYSTEGKKPADLLSLKDLCTIDILPQLIEAGIDSYKIEGRMKQPDYVYTVVDVYRRYADLYLSGEMEYQVDPEDRNRLFSAYRRRGYTEGYYRKHNGKDMISFGRIDDCERPEQIFLGNIQEKINGKLIFSAGEPVKLSLECNGHRAECQGGIPEPAKNQPVTEERIKKQMSKTGNTEFAFHHLEVQMNGDLFWPVQAFNELRREGLEQLKNEILKKYYRHDEVDTTELEIYIQEDNVAGSEDHLRLAVTVQNIDQLKMAVEEEGVSRIYVESETAFDENLLRYIKEKRKEKEFFLAMPYIFREQAKDMYEQIFCEADKYFNGVMVRNLDSLQWLKRLGYRKPVWTDYNVYTFNRYSKVFLKKAGAEGFTASVELNRQELEKLGLDSGSVIVYGYQPVMISANCIRKTIGNCKHQRGWISLSDRYKKKFMVKICCEYCYNVVYNTSPLYLADKAEEILEMQPQEVRLNFTTENCEEMKLVMEQYREAFLGGVSAGRPSGEFTRGHYKRGVK